MRKYCFQTATLHPVCWINPMVSGYCYLGYSKLVPDLLFANAGLFIKTLEQVNYLFL